MARPKKKGLDYFPLDVDIFEDDKLFDVQNEYGPLGEVIYMRLLCLVYKNGYYYKFDNIDKLAAMMIRSIGNRWARDKKTVKEVILYLAKINLFSEELMLRNVITSRSIQERYLLAVERRQSKIEEYNLLEKENFQEGSLNAPKNKVSVAETEIIVTETPVNVSNNATKESKVKENKVNMSSDVSTALKNLTQEQYSDLVNMSSSVIVDKYIDKIIDWQRTNHKTVKNPFGLISKWIQEDIKKNSKTNSNKDTSYDLDEWEKYAMSLGTDSGAGINNEV